MKTKPICEEMQKLRDALDELGVKWDDDSCSGITQTTFKVGRKRWSVITGEIAMGGSYGLLEAWDYTKKNDPVGWLKADEVIEMTCGTHLK